MKFLADMGISPQTVAFLNRLGHSAVHMHDQGLAKMPDPEILDKARSEGYSLLTHDLDFGELLAASRAELPSVIIFRLRNMRPEQVNHALDEIIAKYSTALERGAIVTVTEGQARIRQLPIESVGSTIVS
ncbi:MAG: DUF5615 family PIN-like protein [Pseudomonadota bacterium]